MRNSLADQLDSLAATFAGALIAAIRAASLEDIVKPTTSNPGKRGPGRPPKALAPAPTEKRGPGRPRKVGVSANAPPAATTKRGRGRPRKSDVAKPHAATASKPRPGRLPRRSATDIARRLEQIVQLVKKHPKGLRAEQIRAELKMQAKEMPRILKEGLAKRSLKSKGQKRSTTYSAA